MTQSTNTVADQLTKIMRRDLWIAGVRTRLALNAAEDQFAALEAGDLEKVRARNRELQAALSVCAAVLTGYGPPTADKN